MATPALAYWRYISDILVIWKPLEQPKRRHPSPTATSVATESECAHSDTNIGRADTTPPPPPPPPPDKHADQLSWERTSWTVACPIATTNQIEYCHQFFSCSLRNPRAVFFFFLVHWCNPTNDISYWTTATRRNGSCKMRGKNILLSLMLTKRSVA